MSFGAPLFLLALAAIPVALALYLSAQRRRRWGEAAFATASTMPSVAPVRPGWRRHAPMAVYALALAALALALARPEATVAVPDRGVAIMLATDRSVSMSATDVEPSRLDAARTAAEDFLEAVPEEAEVGLVTYNDRVRAIETPSTDRTEVRRSLAGLEPGGGTATGDALAAALAALDRARGGEGDPSQDGGRAPAAIVLLSDGFSTLGRDPLAAARAAERRGVRVHTVALGTEEGTIERPTRAGGTVTRRVPPDTESLERIASVTGGRAFAAADELELDAVYQELGERLGTKEERREVTSAFAGGAGLLVLLGGAMSLHWFGRLP